MHLIRGAYAPTSKKRKVKKIDIVKMEIDWRQYNKQMRRQNMSKLQFESLDDYVAYRTGKMKSKKKEFIPYVPPPKTVPDVSPYPSLSSTPILAGGLKKERMLYTGDYVVGIATMHKSNLVPVGRGDNPADYAALRRYK
jgi:hypothetical protein